MKAELILASGRAWACDAKSMLPDDVVELRECGDEQGIH
jgi:hypothetical protein